VKKPLFLLNVFILLTFVAANCGDNKSMVGCENNDNGKVSGPGGNFEYDKVLVLLTDEASALGKLWALSDFPEFAFSEIENKGLIGSKAYLIFHLTEPSRDSVLEAIYKLRARTEVYVAELSWIGTFKLDAELRSRITQDYFDQLIEPKEAYVYLEELRIEKEYGVFEGHIVVRFNPFFSFPDGEGMPIDIGGVAVPYGRARVTIAWKACQVFTLITAQEKNLLSQKSLREIAIIALTDPLFK